ncbi:peptidase family M13 [Teladorsagia circumcincta]|uniref:Peptidase family M13 n=1 Tax=Teladorsagia circumcincta TaxID=45464 RepID=A0A2G9V1S2_TELCI|nr:peptidase family M13 [Teladorsagia circumcincta]
MISLIMEAFVDLLVSEDWLTEETKKFAKQKVRTMKQKIGYPDYLNDSKSVDHEYRLFKVYDGGYYKTKFQFYEQYQRDVLERIAQPVDRERIGARSSFPKECSRPVFPAGILQPVFYSKDFPSSMNFGGIGVVIGHEITHGFDDRGRLYDNLGNIRQWWDNVTIAKFEKKAECIEKQYSDYMLDQIAMKINGRSTKGENIADNGGLKQAYKAYKKYQQSHRHPPRLPGVNLTHDQLFFLNYAQIWCGTMNDKEAVRKLRTSEHSPGPIRVKGPLSNSVDFATAFNCPAGSPMNPHHKCRSRDLPDLQWLDIGAAKRDNSYWNDCEFSPMSCLLRRRSNYVEKYDLWLSFIREASMAKSEREVCENLPSAV